MFGLQPCSLIVPAPRAADYGKLKNKPFIFTTPKLWTALVLLLTLSVTPNDDPHRNV